MAGTLTNAFKALADLVPRPLRNEEFEETVAAITTVLDAAGGDAVSVVAAGPSQTAAALPPPPFDPKVVLEKIAEAVAGAEDVLNAANFVIASGAVTADLHVDVGNGLAGAHTTLSMNIVPKPQG